MRSKLLLLMSKKKAASAITTLSLTATTTGAATLTLQGLTVAAGKTVTVDWGDGNSNTYTAGAGTRTHDYAGAGAWTVKISNTPNITLLDLRDTKLSGTISATNPMPAGLTTLTLNSMPNLTYNVNTAPLPVGLTKLDLQVMNGLTYNVNANPLPSGIINLTLSLLPGLTYNVNTNPLPAGLTTIVAISYLSGLTWNITTGSQWPTAITAMTVVSCPLVTVSVWENNAISAIRAENAYSQANVDAFLAAILANKANFTYATPTLDLLGGSNAAPSGTYQAADPVTSGNESKYALVNGNGSYAPGPEWTVTTA